MSEPTTPASGVDAARLALLMRMIPDLRVVLVLGLLALVFDVLDMIFKRPELLKDPAFMTFVGIFAGGSGLGLAVAHSFGGTKTGSDVMTKQSDALIKTTETSGGAS